MNKLNCKYDYDVNIIIVYLTSPFVGWSAETHNLAGYLSGPPGIKTSIRSVYGEVESGVNMKTAAEINILVYVCLLE